MFTIIDGNVGSGKTYYAVYAISLLSPEEQKKVIHNVEGLKIGRTFESIKQEFQISIEGMFSNKFHLENNLFHGHLFVLDESSSIFHDKYQNTDVFEFFQKHRHYGIDIIFLTPDMKLLSYKIQIICEYKLRAVSDTTNPFIGFFCYRKLVKDESVGRVFRRKKKSVYALYKSSDYDQTKVRKKARPMFVLALLILLGALFTITYVLNMKKTRTNVLSDTQKVLENNFSKPSKNISKNNSEISQNIEKKQYPSRLIEKFGGALYPLDVVVIDETEINVVVNNQLLPSKLWPYQIIKINGKWYSIIEEDLYQDLQSEKIARIENSKSNIDPNEKYIYKEQSLNSTFPSQENHLAQQSPGTINNKNQFSLGGAAR